MVWVSSGRGVGQLGSWCGSTRVVVRDSSGRQLVGAATVARQRDVDEADSAAGVLHEDVGVAGGGVRSVT